MTEQKQKEGSVGAFSKNWKERKESLYTHWTKEEPKNQIQLAFRNHWALFSELMQDVRFNGRKQVLEIGCGRGSLSCYFSDAGFDCTLADISTEVINIAEKIFKKNNLKGKFAVEDTCNLSFKDNSFDVLFSIGLMEHFEEIEKPLTEQVRVLAKGGLFLSYIVPKYEENVQQSYNWINDILQGYYELDAQTVSKEDVFRSDYDSERYLKVLRKLPLDGLQVSGVYPLPMISHSIDFPFSLMPEKSELALVKRFKKILKKRHQKTKNNPWLCEEGYGQAFLIWGFKK